MRRRARPGVGRGARSGRATAAPARVGIPWWHPACFHQAAVCHGPQLLVEADAVRGKTLASWPSVRKDLENAGAHWVDRQVVEDGNLITSRKPDDLEAFSEAILRRLETSRAQAAL